MSHVLGIPLIKGNSNVQMGCKLGAVGQSDGVGEGLACGIIGGDIEPIISDLDQGGFYGIAFDRNDCARVATVVRSAELVLVQTDGTSPANGTKALFNAAGQVSATGTWTINGMIRSELMPGINGKTGETVADCVLISINSVEFDGGAPPLAAAKESK
jgi:hypothetical protein